MGSTEGPSVCCRWLTGSDRAAEGTHLAPFKQHKDTSDSSVGSCATPEHFTGLNPENECSFDSGLGGAGFRTQSQQKDEPVIAAHWLYAGVKHEEREIWRVEVVP